MAKQLVTHTCGHTSEQSMFGAHKERDRRAAWFASKPCDACQAIAAAGHPIEVRITPGVDGRALFECSKDTYANRDRLKAAGYRFGAMNHWVKGAQHKLEVVQEIAAAMDRGWIVISPAGSVIDTPALDALRAKVAV